MKVIDLKIAKQILQVAIDALGADYKDPEGSAGGDGYCTYWDAELGRPACVVAVGMFKLGLADQETLIRWDHSPETGKPESIGDLEVEDGVHLTEEARNYLGEAQLAQDAGRTWGQAKERAEAWLVEEIWLTQRRDDTY